MAQLSDDCFAFGGPLMTVADAEQLITERLAPVAEIESCPLRDARGRVLARDLISPVDLPPFDNSAVDGFALAHASLAERGEARLRVEGRLQAGSILSGAVLPGVAIRIFTGAPMPAGTDTVFMQEDCRVEGDSVMLPAGLKQGANRRLRGEDVKAGAVVLPGGCRLGPQHIAIASAVGATHVPVRRRIRVALFSTGNEISEPGEPLRPGAIYDANRPLLAEMARTLGADVTDLGILRDDEGQLAVALAQAANTHDLVITSGGVSMGEADLVRTVVEKIGKLVFWRVAIKPGRPVALAVLPSANGQSQAAFAGLPGNPVAAFVTFARIVRPILLRLSGAQSEPFQTWPVRSQFSYRKKEGRREYVRVTLQAAKDGTLEAVKFRQDGAGVISSLVETHGLIELPEDVTEISSGTPVNFLSYATIMSGV